MKQYAPMAFYLMWLSACVTQPTQLNKPTINSVELRKQEAEKIAAVRNMEQEQRQVEQKRATREKADAEEKDKQINVAYINFMKTNKCDTKHWSRYEFGGYFQRIANDNKISPYDALFGDAYTKRNISSLIWAEAWENYIKYIAHHLPAQIGDKLGQGFPTELEKSANQRAVFNASVKRDFECYKKLK